MAPKKRLIDANALTQFVEERTGGVWIYKPDFLWAVAKQPTVDAVEVVHGRWLDGKKSFFDNRGNYICSNCYSHTGIVKFNYCPNCGARMDGDGNNV